MELKQRGFTLGEIAVVLVIVGLLLGGNLKSQEMIVQAKSKNVVGEFNGIAAAVGFYQDRYRALPGDDANAATRWATVAPGVVSGNGDGQFTGTYNNVLTTTPTAAQETNTFWWHLRLAGFIAGPTTAGAASGQQPSNAANGIAGVQTGSGASTLAFTSNIVCMTNLPDRIAIAIDARMDDGSSNSGLVRGILQAAPDLALRAQVAGDVYAENGTNQYTLCKGL